MEMWQIKSVQGLQNINGGEKGCERNFLHVHYLEIACMQGTSVHNKFALFGH